MTEGQVGGAAGAAEKPGRHAVWRRVAAGLVLLLLMGGAGFGVWVRRDTQALPKTVDLVRSIVGDAAILWLEERYYGVQNRLEERAYARARMQQPSPTESGMAVSATSDNPASPGGAAAEPVSPAPTQAAKPSPTRPAAVSINLPGREPAEWIDKGRYLRTQVQPEPRTGSVCDLAWIKPGAHLHAACGTAEPARSRGTMHPEHLATAFMAFSGGFQYRHLRGGMMVQGHVYQPMMDHLGTLVVFNDYRVKIGKWGRDWTAITPIMRDVRQCLLLVDRGQFNEGVNYNAYALSRAVRVFRSALGVTAEGTLVYAAGNSLSAEGLARALLACGVVQALHLDMNYGNATCGVFTHTAAGLSIAPLTDRFPDPSRFLSANYRDFLYLTG